MRILHTSDWHVGRRLGRHDRTEETSEALDEVVRIAEEERVDLVVVSGDVFDRPVPPVEALSLGLGALLRLAEGRPVVVVAGNHDSPELFDALAPLLRPRGVHADRRDPPPDAGGLLGPDELGVAAVVAGFPFLREGRVVDFMAQTGRWYGQYAERVAAITGAYNEALVAARRRRPRPDPGRALHGDGRAGVAQRARTAHRRRVHRDSTGDPAGPQYVALGHIHAPQSVPGAPVPAEYAGSLSPSTSARRVRPKRVVLVDVEPGTLATVVGPDPRRAAAGRRPRHVGCARGRAPRN